MNKPGVRFPYLSSDIQFIHAPAIFDFRGRRDIYFPFLGTSGDVPITPLYEYIPLGFKTLDRFLTDRGHNVKIINLSTLLILFPNLDLCELIMALDTKLVGIDLHWMVHVQGSIAIAEQIKRVRPELPVIFGGISSTYYSGELIRRPEIDMVMRGYDTHEPMAILLEKIKKDGDFRGIPNLLWKSRDGQIHDNGFTYSPKTLGYGIDWSKQPKEANTQTLPIREVISTVNAGCKNNCGWCGGSGDAFKRIFKHEKSIVHKPLFEVDNEFDSLKRLKGVEQYHLYSVGTYNCEKKYLDVMLDRVAGSNIGSVNYEQYHLTLDNVLKRMVEANKRTIITLSPESHDLKVARLAGRGVYTNDHLEHWIERALDFGIYQIDIWYFIGMPEQDEASVMGTVDYCRHLLKKFKGKRVHPLLCPMIPFLDPGSIFFENPDKNGYRIFFRSLEEHRRGMEWASIIKRINYETKWLSRSDLVHIGYKAVRRLMEAKAETGLMPSMWVKNFNAKIDDALDFIDLVHEVDSLKNEEDRAMELSRLGDEILQRNNMILYSGVMNQGLPLSRQIGGRWFDHLGWETEILEAANRIEG